MSSWRTYLPQDPRIKQVQFRHERGDPGEGSTTVCTLMVEGADGQEVVVAGTRRCSARDRWNRKLGNAIARGRAEKALALYWHARMSCGPEEAE